MADGDHLIFINYRGSDQHWGTELVYARLTEAFGTDAVFKAGNALPLGEEFPPALLREATDGGHERLPADGQMTARWRT